MKYSYILRNDNHILRPVTVEDAEFIVKLRHQPHTRGVIQDTPMDVEVQRQWIREQRGREMDFYWIRETFDHTLCGTAGLYHYDAKTRMIETGRWVGLKDAPNVNLLAERIQVRDFIYDELDLNRIEYDVVDTNKPVVRYHKLCGGELMENVNNRVRIGSAYVNQVRFFETRETWKRIRARLCRLAGIPESRPYGTVERVMIF